MAGTARKQYRLTIDGQYKGNYSTHAAAVQAVKRYEESHYGKRWTVTHPITNTLIRQGVVGIEEK